MMQKQSYLNINLVLNVHNDNFIYIILYKHTISTKEFNNSR